MFVMWLSKEYRGTGGGLQRAPSAADVERAIRELDGVERTLVVLSGESEAAGRMSVGGSASGRLAVGVTVGEGNDRWLVGPDTASMQEVEVPFGGQTLMLPARRCVLVEAAVKAALFYREFGATDPALEWDDVPW
ncbi:MAG: hypothetical protein KIT58_00935 [Planctomycetota bacterium]|nr:hypothetical protein [Planctomycetota bacterium]